MLQHRQLFEMSLANWKSERASRHVLGWGWECYSFSLFAKNEIRKQFCKFTEGQRKKFFSSALPVFGSQQRMEILRSRQKAEGNAKKKINRIVHKVSKVMQNT